MRKTWSGSTSSATRIEPRDGAGGIVGSDCEAGPQAQAVEDGAEGEDDPEPPATGAGREGSCRFLHGEEGFEGVGGGGGAAGVEERRAMTPAAR